MASLKELVVNDESWVCDSWVCTICGDLGSSPRGKTASVREGFACPNCRASLRYRNQAAAMLDAFAEGRACSLKQALELRLFDHLAIYEAALRGPFVNAFKGHGNYTRSYFWPDVEPGAIHDGVRCEDLTRLSFDSERFDLVLTSDVFEHVFEPQTAFREVYRVLRPGGLHIFSVPIAWRTEPRSVTRARRSGNVVEHLVSPRFHRAADGSDSLVVTDWGSDLVSLLNTIGFKTQACRRALPLILAFFDVTFVSRKGW